MLAPYEYAMEVDPVHSSSSLVSVSVQGSPRRRRAGMKRARSPPSSPSAERPSKRASASTSAGGFVRPLVHHGSVQPQHQPPANANTSGLYGQTSPTDDWVSRTQGLRIGKECARRVDGDEGEGMTVDNDDAPSHSIHNMTTTNSLPAPIVTAQSFAIQQSSTPLGYLTPPVLDTTALLSAQASQSPSQFAQQLTSPSNTARRSTQRFTMGPRADCEKCRLGVPGHWMHFD